MCDCDGLRIKTEEEVRKEAEFRVRRKKIDAMKDDVTDRLYRYVVKVSDNLELANSRDIASMIKAAEVLLDSHI